MQRTSQRTLNIKFPQCSKAKRSTTQNRQQIRNHYRNKVRQQNADEAGTLKTEASRIHGRETEFWLKIFQEILCHEVTSRSMYCKYHSQKVGGLQQNLWRVFLVITTMDSNRMPKKVLPNSRRRIKSTFKLIQHKYLSLKEDKSGNNCIEDEAKRK